MIYLTIASMESQKKSKKKFWKPPSFEDFNVPIPNKKIKLDNEDEEKIPEIPNESKQPKTIGELAVHPKKIGEIRNWIKRSLNEISPILLITGPAGCGKTVTLKVSAQEEGIFIKEWINPIDKTDFKIDNFQTETFDKFNYLESKQTDKFEDFVFRSSRYKSLFDSEENLLILVEDIPNIFVWRPKQFHSFLEKYKRNGKCPIVFILTDDQNLNLTNSLFPVSIRNRLNITNIKFNPVNNSSLVKNLKALCDLYSCEKLSSLTLDNIIKNSGGDLRSATNDLLLLLRTNQGGSGKINSISEKDVSFDFYHTIGRILYPKLKPEKDGENSNKIFLHDVQQIAENWSSSFLTILHENYLKTFTKLKDVVGGADCFSFCDVLQQNQELEDYVSLIGVITLMLNNTMPKKTGFNPLKKSLRVDCDSFDDDINMVDGGECQLRRRDFLLDVSSYLKIINVKDDMNLPRNEMESDDEDIVIEEFDD